MRIINNAGKIHAGLCRGRQRCTTNTTKTARTIAGRHDDVLYTTDESIILTHLSITGKYY